VAKKVTNDDIIKGYPIDKENYIPVTKDELENIALESTRTIDIDEFVHKDDIDTRCLIRPYYIVPDGKVGHDAFAVIRETIRKMGMVGIGRVVLTSREHSIALEPLGKGLMGNLLRYPYEVRDERDYFDDIQDAKITKDMLELAQHIVEGKSAEFAPEKFEDHYESALTELIDRKRAAQPIKVAAPSRTSGNVVDLMDALRKSLAGGQQSAPAAKAKKTKKRAAGQKEMLLPISGKGEGQQAGRKKAAKSARSPARSRKAG
jgi:DNA end-binding protein Ku